ncbi:hypothetical protein [Streptomyces sp. 150FB]|uniref:hypothetical protein n=1 Tax=Streptomyces sp. 150FB TaxID=1576605 RepID=UPI000A650556|nr:hypothetical protein [Streptomyces sp. 150FB]
MSLFLFLLLVAVGLGITGVAGSGLSYLLVIGVVVFLADLVLLGARAGMRRGRRVTR